jgi:hypothetical protein
MSADKQTNVTYNLKPRGVHAQVSVTNSAQSLAGLLTLHADARYFQLTAAAEVRFTDDGSTDAVWSPKKGHILIANTPTWFSRAQIKNMSVIAASATNLEVSGYTH